MRAYSSKRIFTALAILVSLAVLVVAGAVVAEIYVAPGYVRVFEGQTFSVDMGPVGRGAVVADPPDSLLMEIAIGSKVEVTPTKTGRMRLEVRLFNAIPVKRLVVDVVPQMRVIPGGHSLGILPANPGGKVKGIIPLSLSPPLTGGRPRRTPPALPPLLGPPSPPSPPPRDR
ncbi:MAG TPA: hypothetical protein DCQ13_02080 [Firmicutes bacterium]|nr:hypothetical protein [Bacillota bacterium]